MLSMSEAFIAHRGEDSACVGKWILRGKKYKAGAYAVEIVRSDHPDELAMAEFGAANLTIEQTKSGVTIAFALSAEDTAKAQGPRRPISEHLCCRLLHDGAPIYCNILIVFPPSASVDANQRIPA